MLVNYNFTYQRIEVSENNYLIDYFGSYNKFENLEAKSTFFVTFRWDKGILVYLHLLNIIKACLTTRLRLNRIANLSLVLSIITIRTSTYKARYLQIDTKQNLLFKQYSLSSKAMLRYYFNYNWLGVQILPLPAHTYNTNLFGVLC